MLGNGRCGGSQCQFTLPAGFACFKISCSALPINFRHWLHTGASSFSQPSGIKMASKSSLVNRKSYSRDGGNSEATIKEGTKNVTSSSAIINNLLNEAKNARNNNTPSARAAFFDVDGTVSKTNVVLAYFTFRMTELSIFWKLIWIPWFLLTAVFYLIVDWFHRPTFNKIFYMSYKGRAVQSKTSLAELIYKKYYEPRLFKDAVELIRRLKAEGYHIVLVTGSLDFLIAPLALDLGADFVFAAEIIEENDRLTGKLKGMAVGNEEKAHRVQQYAKEHGISLAESLAFGDSIADLPMLEIVGWPCAVNPDSRLRAIAIKRGWPMVEWLVSTVKKV